MTNEEIKTTNPEVKPYKVEINPVLLGLVIFTIAIVFSSIGFYGGYESYLVFNPPPPPEPTVMEKALALVHWPWF